MKKLLRIVSSICLTWLMIAPGLATTVAPPDVALVLGGGGARGFAHVGVLLGLEKAGIPINLIVGTSIGSLVGALYADDPNATAVSNLLLSTPEKNLLDVTFLHAYLGPFKGNKLEQFIAAHIDDAQFDQLKIQYIAVATDLQTGQTVPLTQGNVAEAVRASMALPPYFPPGKWQGQLMVDGGITDPVPVDIAKTYHPKVIIAVSIARAPDTYPAHNNALSVYFKTLVINKKRFDEMSAKGADVILYPQVAQTGLFDDSHRQQLVQAGEDAVQQALPQICALLKQNHIKSGCDTSIAG